MVVEIIQVTELLYLHVPARTPVAPMEMEIADVVEFTERVKVDGAIVWCKRLIPNTPRLCIIRDVIEDPTVKVNEVAI